MGHPSMMPKVAAYKAGGQYPTNEITIPKIVVSKEIGKKHTHKNVEKDGYNGYHAPTQHQNKNIFPVDDHLLFITDRVELFFYLFISTLLLRTADTAEQFFILVMQAEIILIAAATLKGVQRTVAAAA